jgi:hypothetical protein
VVCSAAIPAGTVLFQIPHALSLSSRTTDVHTQIRAAKLTNWNALAVAIMREFTRGADSPWAPYLALLPRQFTMPVFWPLDSRTAHEGQLKGNKKNKQSKSVAAAASSDGTKTLSALSDSLTFADLDDQFRGTGLLHRAKAMRQHWHEQYKRHVRPFILKHLDFFASEQQTLAAYERAIAIISSYSFTDSDGVHAETGAEPVDEIPAANDEQGSDQEDQDEEDEEEEEEEQSTAVTILAPFADLLNHHSAHNNARLHMNAPGAFQMVATRDMQPGDVVYNTYGNHSNTELLLKYGFVNANNESLDDVRFDLSDDLVKLAESLYDSYTKDMEERLDFLDECRVMYLTPPPPPPPPPPPSASSDDSAADEPVALDFEDAQFVVRADGKAPRALIVTLALLLCKRATIAKAEELIVGDSSDDESDEDETEDSAEKDVENDDDGVDVIELIALVRAEEPAALYRAWNVLRQAVDARLMAFDVVDPGQDVDTNEERAAAEELTLLQSMPLEQDHVSAAFVKYCACAVRASQRRVLRTFLRSIEFELEALNATGVSDAKKRKEAPGDSKDKKKVSKHK